MTSLPLNADTLSRLHSTIDVVEICDNNGRVLGYFHPLRPSDAVAHFPFSDETLLERRQQRSGKPLSEVLADLASS